MKQTNCTQMLDRKSTNRLSFAFLLTLERVFNSFLEAQYAVVKAYLYSFFIEHLGPICLFQVKLKVTAFGFCFIQNATLN